MNAVEKNRYTEAWQAFGLAHHRPRAVLCVSAHWYTGETAVTAMDRPRTIHDFGGFPDELYQMSYPAPGDPDLATEVADLLGASVSPDAVALDRSWGLDHGAWSVLVHSWPEADVPVLQLSIDARQSFDRHLALGAALAPLRQRGVIVIGSGNVVHNLRALAWGQPDAAFDWAVRFDRAVTEVMREDPASLPRLAGHPDFAAAHPTPDHFIPLLYVAGLAAAAGQRSHVLVDGIEMGSAGMTSYALDPVASAT